MFSQADQLFPDSEYKGALEAADLRRDSNIQLHLEMNTRKTTVGANLYHS